MLKAIFKGSLYIIYYKIYNKNVKIQFPLKAFSSVKIIGPGSVFIGRNCAVFMNGFKGLTIVTLSRLATVKVGNECSLAGVTIRCSSTIEIGDRTMTALSLVQDSLLINSDKDESTEKKENVLGDGPIFIGENVWLGGQTCILGGCKIGSDSVISAGSVCYNTEFKRYCLVIGNPARRGLPIDNILKLKG